MKALVKEQPKVYLMILDGFGEGKNYEGNAIKKAKMPNWEKFKKSYPNTLLKSSGQAVGLPANTIGNSEVGHFTMGSGRVVFQSLEAINRSILNKTFFKKEPLIRAINKVKKNPKAALHLIGMISDAGVHSELNHLFALLELVKKHNVAPVYIHAITDGRDVPEQTAAIFVKKIQEKINQLGLGQKLTNGLAKTSIATIVGRYYAMDRDQNWDRVEQAYNLYTLGKGVQETNAISAIQNAYKRGIKTDYYIDPIILEPNSKISNTDSVIFWNFRTDRTRQITQAFTGENKIGFKPQKTVRPFFVCFGDYSKKAPVVFPTEKIINNLGEITSKSGLKQLRIAETEKYAHVTYFFNSQIEKSFKGEDRILIPSSKVKSYAQKPEMSAAEITQRALKEISGKKYTLIVQNFANADLVGHSGELKPTIKACEVLDKCIGQIAEATLKYDYNLIITADHGNAEYMIYEKNGEQCPSHTQNPVPCLLISKHYKNVKLAKGMGLKDIAPTILKIMKIKKPKEMTGKSIII